MKTIILKSLELRNFKGIKDFTLNPNQELTSIFGTNRSGKTTLQNALIWLFWGKDQYDRKDFNIKTLDENNIAISQIEHEVCGVLLINSEENKLQRIYKETWSAIRGEDTTRLTGHTTNFLWNNVPMNLGEYTAKLTEVICDEILFKMITNPLFFNNEKMMPWLKRREVLTQIVGGEESDQSIAESDPKFTELFDKLTNKSIIEYKKEIANGKKLLKEKKDEIPARIDELARNTPAAPEEPYPFIQDEITKLQKEIVAIDLKIHDKTKGTEQFYLDKTSRVEKIGKLKVKKSEIEQAARESNSKTSLEHNQKQREYTDLCANIQKAIDSDSEEIVRKKAKAKLLDESLPPLRKKIEGLEKLEFFFDEKLASCPTCKRRFEEGDVEAKETDLRDRFNADIVKQTNDINIEGKAKKAEIETLKEEILVHEANIDLAREELSETQKEAVELKNSATPSTVDGKLATNKGYTLLCEDIKKLEFENNQAEPTVNVDNLNIEHNSLSDKVKELEKVLATQEAIDKSAIRKQELLDDQKNYAQQIADLEKDEFVIENFEKVKSDRIEKPINDLFKTVRFKLYKTQLNEGLNPCCECLINGVPFAAANSADQIKSGIEIINVLNEFFQVSLPITIDNCESVVTPLPETSNQLIKLYASEKDLTLRVE